MIDRVLTVVIWGSFVAIVCSLGLAVVCTARYVLDQMIDRRANRDRREHIAAVTAARVDAPPVLSASYLELERIYRLPAREPRSHA